MDSELFFDLLYKRRNASLNLCAMESAPKIVERQINPSHSKTVINPDTHHLPKTPVRVHFP